MKNKKLIYRVGDIVKIINPLFVTRVGYPWDKDYVKKEVITQEQHKAISDMLEKFGVNPSLDLSNSTFDRAFNKILDEMAYWVLKTQGFGGRERTIHTENIPERQGKLAKVVSKRTVKTGEYFAPSYYTDYWSGGTECDLGGLRNEKTHVLLELDVFTDEGMWALISYDDKKTEIDSVNVELYKQQKVHDDL